MQCEELEECPSRGEREEWEAKSEEFGTILGWDGVEWNVEKDGVEWKIQASCASPSSSSPVGIILLPAFLSDCEDHGCRHSEEIRVECWLVELCFGGGRDEGGQDEEGAETVTRGHPIRLARFHPKTTATSLTNILVRVEVPTLGMAGNSGH